MRYGWLTQKRWRGTGGGTRGCAFRGTASRDRVDALDGVPRGSKSSAHRRSWASWRGVGTVKAAGGNTRRSHHRDLGHAGGQQSGPKLPGLHGLNPCITRALDTTITVSTLMWRSAKGDTHADDGTIASAASRAPACCACHPHRGGARPCAPRRLPWA